MSLIPWPYRWLALALAAAALIGSGWIKGAGHVYAQWDAAVQQQALQAAAARERQARVTVKVVTQYVDRVRVVREKGDTIIKEVPVYVPAQADAAALSTVALCACTTLPPQANCPPPPEILMRPPQGLALSAVAGTVAANYQTCHENAEQLWALQRWVRNMSSATK